MYNLNGSMSGPPMLGVDGCTTTATTTTTTLSAGLTVGVCATTPRTPEILNSVMAMTNPLDSYSFSSKVGAQTHQQQSSDSHSSCSGSPLDSPATGTSISSATGACTTATTPTVQQTCSQLIKTSLKLSLEMKRKTSTGDSSGAETSSCCKMIKQDLDSSDDDTVDSKSPKSGVSLTAEDEDRRRRRRERNKIAATKCRMKKRERTINLVSEAEILETQNVDLKTQVRNLEIERRTLTEMLQSHGASCIRGDSFQMPVCNVSIGKYLNDIGLGTATHQTTKSSNGKTSDSAKQRLAAIKVTPPHKLQKIPSVNTLKFGSRRSQQQAHIQPAPQTQSHPPSLIETMSSAAAVSTTPHCLPVSIANATNIDCKPLPSMDMGYCDGPSEMLTPTSGYCKSMIGSSNDCYAMSSPDSGFIKSPVDIGGNYATLPPGLIKSDYIPNCETTSVELVEHTSTLAVLGHRLDLDAGDTTNGDRAIEFILKSELVDGNDSPYTTVQSADRFLFDGGAETFDSEMDSTTPSHTHLPASHPSLIASLHHQHLHHDTLKEHLLMQTNNNNNNNNNLSHINNNNNSHHHHMQHNSNGNNATLVSSGGIGSIIEFNNSCQQFIDNSLLKGDFLTQNCEFLTTLAGDGCDSQFTTDLDSGVTTYTNMTNGSGCLA